jgi:hypothetical protein
MMSVSVGISGRGMAAVGRDPQAILEQPPCTLERSEGADETREPIRPAPS